MAGEKGSSFRDIMQGCVVAFGMYSRIPVLRLDWTEENMRYSMCFFPLIGAVCGGISLLAKYLCDERGLKRALCAAFLVVIPVLITGGIHLDGLLDTADVLSAQRSVPERLQIMTDPHVGAFAVIIGCCYFLLQFGFYTEVAVDRHLLLLVGIGFVLSRAYSGLAMVLFPKAKETGLLRLFSDAAVGRRVAVVLTLYILAASVALILLDPERGSFQALIALVVFVWYRFFAVRKFGGITGDTEGFFLQVCELAMLMGVVLR